MRAGCGGPVGGNQGPTGGCPDKEDGPARPAAGTAEFQAPVGLVRGKDNDRADHGADGNAASRRSLHLRLEGIYWASGVSSAEFHE